MIYLVSITLLVFLCREIKAKYVGNWENSLLGIVGSVHFDSPTSISLRNFYCDGSNVDLYLYFYDQSRNVGTYKGMYLKFEHVGSRQDYYIFDRPYTNETVLAFMPNGKTVCDVEGLAIWSITLDKPYSVLFVQAQSLHERGPHGECIIIGSTTNKSTPNTDKIIYDNCKPVWGTLYMPFHVYWSLDTLEKKLHIKLCICDSTPTSNVNFYMAFGRSGPDRNASMVGGDVTIIWIEKQLGRPQAVDYFLKSRQQCQNGEGVCPDAYFTNDNCTDDIIPGSVSGGIKDNGETCVTYSKLLQTGDSLCDIKLDPNIEEPMIIAAGYLGDGVLKHFSTAHDFTIKFGRKPYRSCTNLVCSHNCKKFKSSSLTYLHSSTLEVSMTPAGLDQGYNSITGQPNWGNVAFFINNTLVPELVIRRGQTYTFVVQGGYNHPFYITNSKTGGWLRKSIQERKKETIYAGFDSTGYPIRAARLCESHYVHRTDASGCYSSRYYILDLLNFYSPVCDSKQPGVFSWTPDQFTPDVVYYQCAQHPNHGWRIIVKPESYSPPMISKSQKQCSFFFI